MPCSPLEENLFEGLVSAGRLYHFKNRTMVNDRHVSFLIKNMPVDDSTLYGRYNDHFAVLIEGLEERWSDIAKNRLVVELLQMLTQNMTQIDVQFKRFEKTSHEIINNLMIDMRSSLHILDLLEEQENHIIEMVEEALDQLYELSLEGHEIKDSLSESLAQFKDMYSKS